MTELAVAATACEAAHMAIQEHTRKAVGATHPQAMTAAAARFRSLVNVRHHLQLHSVAQRVYAFSHNHRASYLAALTYKKEQGLIVTTL